MFLSKGEAWVVIDLDRWTEKQLEDCHEWSNERSFHKFALSNPMFEYWLLLHFDDPDPKEITKHNITGKLKNFIPNYKKATKECTLNAFTLDNIQQAITRAKKNDTPPCQKWPEKTGTTVYRLVENILKSTPTE